MHLSKMLFRARFLKTLASCLRVDGWKWSFSNTMMSQIILLALHMRCKGRYHISIEKHYMWKCCNKFFISVNFCFSFVSNSLAYIYYNTPKQWKNKNYWDKKFTTTETFSFENKEKISLFKNICIHVDST